MANRDPTSLPLVKRRCLQEIATTTTAAPTTFRHSLPSLCHQTLRHLSEMLLADEIFRLTMVGCKSLTTKLTASVYSLQYKPDPWFSRPWNMDTSAMPNLKSLVAQKSRMEEFINGRPSSPYPDLDILPPGLTSLSLHSDNSCAAVYNLFKLSPLVLPLLNTLNFGFRVPLVNANGIGFPRRCEQATFIACIMLDRPCFVRLSIEEYVSPEESFFSLPISVRSQHLQYLRMPFNVALGKPLPASLETLALRNVENASRLFKILPIGLLHFEFAIAKSRKSNGWSSKHSSLLPRGLKWLKMDMMRTLLPADDSTGFYSSLPLQLTAFDLGMGHGLSKTQFDALPTSLRKSLQYTTVSDSQLPDCYAFAGVLHPPLRNARVIAGSTFENVFRGITEVPLLALMPSQCGRPRTLYGEQPEIEEVSILLTPQIYPPNVVVNLPPRIRHLSVQLQSSFERESDRAKSNNLIHVPHWPITLTTLYLGFDLPATLSLYDLPNLTQLEFIVTPLQEHTSALLPRTLRSLTIRTDDDLTHLEALIRSLPPHLFKLAILHTHERRNMKRTIQWYLTPTLCRYLPRALLYCSLETCIVQQACAPHLPNTLIAMNGIHGVPDWFVPNWSVPKWFEPNPQV